MKKSTTTILSLGVFIAAFAALIQVALASQSFPTINLSFFNPNNINSQTYSYQMTDYDAARNRVVFYPYGSVTAPTGNSGSLLTYNVGSNNFTSTSSYSTSDLSQIIGSEAANFGGGFLDASDTYAYLPPGIINGTGTQRSNALAVQVNLSQQNSSSTNPAAFSSINPRTISGAPNVGSFSGIYGNGYAYFAPIFDSVTFVVDGDLIRYNTAQSFSATSSWSFYNLNNIATPTDASLGGMQSMAYVAPYIYLIPFTNGTNGSPSEASKIIRYNTTQNFQASSSYQTLDLTTLPFPSNIQSELKGFTGGVVDGTNLILVPWGNRSLAQTNSVALIYDTTKQLTDTTAWQYIDLTTVNPNAGGYQSGWIDRDGFIFFVPTHNYNMASPPHLPPFIAWNTALPFTASSSWTSYSNSPEAWSTGAAYDSNNDTAWLAGYGAPGGTSSPVSYLTQVSETFPDTQAPTVPTSLAFSTSTVTSISFNWASSTDNVGVTGYNVYRNSSLVASTTQISFTDTGLSASTTYAYTVSAFDAAGNNSAQSSTLNATTSKDVQAPTVPSGVTGTSTVTSFSLSWNPSTDNVAVTGYIIYANGTKIASTSATTFTTSGWPPNFTESFRISAYDPSSNSSAKSATTTLTTLADTQPPTVPGGVTATATSPSNISISWTASTDNYLVAGYRVYRNNTLLATTTQTNYLDSGLASSTLYSYSISSYDPTPNYSATSSPPAQATTLGGSDSQPPTIPASLSLSTSTLTTITIIWASSTDNVGVTGYDVYRNSALIATTSLISFTDTGLSASTTYAYTVSAYDAAGNNSVQSSSLNANTLADTQAPTVPTGLAEPSSTVATINITWASSTDNVGVTGYNVYRNSSLIATTSVTSYLDSGLTASTSYAYYVSAFDAVGNTSATSTTLNASTTPDTQAPTVPTGVTATGTSPTNISILWNLSTDNVGVTGYNVYRNSSLVGSTSQNNYTDTGLNPGTSYNYNVSAYDAAGNQSASSSPAAQGTTQTGVDTQPPTVPTGLSGSALDTSDIYLSWNASSDNIGVQGYNIYRNGSFVAMVTVATTSDLSYTDSGLSSGTSYSYTISAFDAVGNTSDQSGSINVTTIAASSGGGGGGGGGGSSGGGGGGGYIPPSNPSPSSTPISTPPGLTIPPTTSSGSFTVSLINDNGTYYYINNGQLEGITDPGILASYGFTFSDARAATAQDLALPQGSLLTPNDGSLVKSAQDPTVYLISNQQRYGFTSSSVFLGLGFKFSSVLLVTNPELQALPQAANISTSQAAHLPGVNININGTIYWIGGDSTIHAYPSLDIYNSWSIPNDFSGVVPANSYDLSLPVGADTYSRVLE